MVNEQLLTEQEINEVFELIQNQPNYFQTEEYDELKFVGETVDVFFSISASTNS